MSSDEPPQEGPAEPSHHDDGLDLAKALTRATAKSSPAARRRQRSKDAPKRGRVSGAHPDDRDPQLLDDAMGRLIAHHGWEVDLKVQGVFGRWAELVGSEVADHCTPESFDDGRLVVRTDSTAWATQLKLLAPSIVRRLNEDLGHGTVRLLKVHGPAGAARRYGPLRAPGSTGPGDTYG